MRTPSIPAPGASVRFWSALILLLAAVPACRAPEGHRLADARRAAGAVVFNLGSEPSSLDPARGTRLADLRVIGQCLEGLVRLDERGRLVPAAARSWDVSPDGRTYRFRLRDTRWSNGDPVRSSDFAFAWRRILTPETRSYWTDLFFAIDGAQAFFKAAEPERPRLPLGIETPDDRTLVVRLARPVPYFLSLVALEAYSPLHAATVERLGDGAFRPPDSVANGPFHLVEHQPRRRIVLEPNPHYRDRAAVKLRRVIFVMVENEFTEWTAYRRGEIDITENVDRSVVAKAREWPDFRSVPLVGIYYLSFNCARPPFDRVEVRRAFALSLNRQLLGERITRGGERPATGFVPPGIPDLAGPAGNPSPNPDGVIQSPKSKIPNSTVEIPPDDFRAAGGELVPPANPPPGVAQQLRAAASGLPHGLVYSFAAGETNRSLAVALQLMWRERLGIEVDLQAYPTRLLALNKRNKDYLIASSSWVGDYLDATTFLDIFRSDSSNNVTAWSDPRYDRLLDRAADTTDTVRRARLLHEAERLLFEQMPICPVHFYAIAYLQRPGLEGVERNLLGRVSFARAFWAGRPGD